MAILVTLASQDVTDDILNIDTIERTTDYPIVTETAPTTAQITLSDADGDYSPQNASNFFVSNSQNQNGTKSPVTIRADGQVIFVGQVVELRQSVREGTVRLNCTDLSRNIRAQTVTDLSPNFGNEKAFKLIPETPTQEDPINARYPLTCGITPLSDNSITVSKAFNQTLDIVSRVADEGVLDSDNVEITDEAVVSEGGPIDSVAGGAYPQLRGKAPMRYRSAVSMITAILTHYGLSHRYMEFPPKYTDFHRQSLGRPGYETVLGEIGSSNHLNWIGLVTDMLLDGSDLYIALSCREESPYNSYLIKWTESDDTWSQVTTSGTAWEIWGLEKVGTNIVMLQRRKSGSTISYQLRYFPIATPSSQNNISTGSYPPQLRHFYQAGSSHAFSKPHIELPDTRRRMIAVGNYLYYGYGSVKGSPFGVARVQIGSSAQAVLTVNGSDGYNQAGFAFAMSGNNPIFATTFMSDTQSTLKVVRGS